MSTSTQANDTDPIDTSKRGDNEAEQQEEETPARLTSTPRPAELSDLKDQVASRRSGDGGPEYKDQVRSANREDHQPQPESAALPLDKQVQEDEGPEYKDQVRPKQVELTPSDQGPNPATVVAQLMTQEPVMISAEPIPVDETIQNEIERLRELERQPVIQAQVSPAFVDEAPAAHGKKRLVIGIIALLVVGLVVAVVVPLTRDQSTEIRANEPTESPTDAPVGAPTPVPTSMLSMSTPGPTPMLSLCNLEVTVECVIAGISSQSCDNYTVPEPDASQIPQAIEVVITFAADQFFTLLSFYFGGSDLSSAVTEEMVEPGSSVVVVVEASVVWSVQQTFSQSIEVVYELFPNPNGTLCTYFGNATFVTGNPPQ